MSRTINTGSQRELSRGFRARWLRAGPSWRWLVRASFVLLVSGYALVELSLRLAFAERLPLGEQPAIYVSDDKFGYRYLPGASSELCIPGICRPVTINPGGLIGPHQAKERATPAYRIAFVGSCEGTGFWMRSGQPHPALLERLLREEGLDVEVYNFSIDGLFLDYERAVIAHDVVPEYAPDLVVMETNYVPLVQTNQRRELYRGYVVSWGADIPGAFEDARQQIDFIESHSVLIDWYEWSYVPRALARWYASHSDDWRVPYLRAFSLKRFAGEARPTPLSTKESLDYLLETRDRLASRGAALVQFGSLIHPTAVARGLRYVDIKFPGDPRYRNRFDTHMNERGQELVAQQLYAALRSYVVAGRSRAEGQQAAKRDGLAEGRISE